MHRYIISYVCFQSWWLVVFLSSCAKNGHGFFPASITNCLSRNRSTQQTALGLADDSIHDQKESQNEANSEENGDDIISTLKNSEDKPKSRLALLAEDWLEEEEDELASYWERFDENKNGNVSADFNSTSFASSGSYKNIVDSSSETLTTEERLERYYDSRGINKKKEEQFASQIEYAINAAKKAATAEIAIAELEKVQPYLQVNSKLGGSALYELVIAMWQRDGIADEDLIEKLIENAHIRRQLQQLMKQGKPPTRQNQNSMWQDILNPNKWWN